MLVDFFVKNGQLTHTIFFFITYTIMSQSLQNNLVMENENWQCTSQLNKFIVKSAISNPLTKIVVNVINNIT